jgi:RNA polymerase-binding transcription factor DksA
MAAPDRAMRHVLAVPENQSVEDQVPLLHEQHLVLTRHSRDRDTLGLIEAALARLDRDEYGVCEECDGEIARKRLLAVPWALRCKSCQEQYERTHGGRDNDASAMASAGRN